MLLISTIPFSMIYMNDKLVPLEEVAPGFEHGSVVPD